MNNEFMNKVCVKCKAEIETAIVAPLYINESKITNDSYYTKKLIWFLIS